MNYYLSNIFENLKQYIKQFYIPLGVKFFYLTIVVLATYFFKYSFSDQYFILFIEVTSIAGISQQIFRFGSSFKIFDLKDKSNLDKTQFITLVRAIILSGLFICLHFIFSNEKSTINLLIGLMMGIMQVYMFNKFAYLTQNAGYVISSIFDPAIIQVGFSILLYFYAAEKYGFITFCLLITSFFLIIFIKISQNRFKISINDLFVIGKNEIWAFLTNIVSICGPLLALYLLASKENSDVLYDLKIIERSLAVILLLPSILNPYLLKNSKNNSVNLNLLSFFISIFIIISIVSFYSLIHFAFLNEIWFYLLLLLIFVTPLGSFYGFRLSVQYKANYFFWSTLIGMLMQWIVFYINFSEKAIIYGVIINYLIQYTVPIILRKKINQYVKID